jgi:signal transduction histidine kinase
MRPIRTIIARLSGIELHIEPQTLVMVADAKPLFRVFSNLLSLSPRYSSRFSMDYSLR